MVATASSTPWGTGKKGIGIQIGEKNGLMAAHFPVDNGKWENEWLFLTVSGKGMGLAHSWKHLEPEILWNVLEYLDGVERTSPENIY